VLEELRRAADEVEQINQVTHGRLTIGFSSLIALTVFPAVAEGFKQALPQMLLTLKRAALFPVARGAQRRNRSGDRFGGPDAAAGR
jgi:LysR family tdc operon transcriptional activator